MSASFWRNLIGTLTNASPSAGFQRVELTGAVLGSGSVVELPQLITFDNGSVVSPIVPVLASGMYVRLTLTSGAAYTLSVPTGSVAAGARLVVQVRNTFGVAGAMTFGAGFKLGAAWTQPANGFSRAIEFLNDGTNYVEISRTAADVAN